MDRVVAGSKYSGRAVDDANAHYARQLVHAKDLGAWQRADRWRMEFQDFARRVCAQSGLKFDRDLSIADNEMSWLQWWARVKVSRSRGRRGDS